VAHPASRGGGRPGVLGRILYFVRWAWRRCLSRPHTPLTSTLILTDRCDLRCRHCVVAHLGYPPRTFDDICTDLGLLYATGARILVITGGEPFVWTDRERDLGSVVAEARRLGFFRIVVCTNGLHELRSDADYLWVSLDGVAVDHRSLRGRGPRAVIDNVATSSHRRIYANLTVTTLNMDRIREGATAVLSTPNVRGVLFHLFTPYIGADPQLRLSPPQRHRALQEIRRVKRRHPLRVTNTFAGLKAMERNTWPRPLWSGVVSCEGRLSPCCCRAGIADERTCRECGCSPAAETWVLERLRLSAILENLRHL
jgi:MoaA/NifB/PqqE/SkfB family radical SAM enzyme